MVFASPAENFGWFLFCFVFLRAFRVSISISVSVTGMALPCRAVQVAWPGRVAHLVARCSLLVADPSSQSPHLRPPSWRVSMHYDYSRRPTLACILLFFIYFLFTFIVFCWAEIRLNTTAEKGWLTTKWHLIKLVGIPANSAGDPPWILVKLICHFFRRLVTKIEGLKAIILCRGSCLFRKCFKSIVVVIAGYFYMYFFVRPKSWFFVTEIILVSN